MLLLSYQYQHPVDSLSGPGWSWMTKLKTFKDDQADSDYLKETIEELYRENAESFHRWENQSPKWRDKTHQPPHRFIRIQEVMDWGGEANIHAQGQEVYEATLEALKAEQGKKAQRMEEAREARERADYERLSAKYGSAENVTDICRKGA